MIDLKRSPHVSRLSSSTNAADFSPNSELRTPRTLPSELSERTPFQTPSLSIGLHLYMRVDACYVNHLSSTYHGLPIEGCPYFHSTIPVSVSVNACLSVLI